MVGRPADGDRSDRSYKKRKRRGSSRPFVARKSRRGQAADGSCFPEDTKRIHPMVGGWPYRTSTRMGVPLKFMCFLTRFPRRMLGDGSRRNREGDEVKYFTPDLLADCRSLDPDVAEAAAAKWQRRAAAYRKRLHEIQNRLPHSVRQLTRSLTLHDAYLLTVNVAKVRGRTQFFLSFQLDDKDGRGVQLRYDVVKSLKVLHAQNVPNDTVLFALYDEFDVSADLTLTHSIPDDGRSRVSRAVHRSARYPLHPGSSAGPWEIEHSGVDRNGGLVSAQPPSPAPAASAATKEHPSCPSP